MKKLINSFRSRFILWAFLSGIIHILSFRSVESQNSYSKNSRPTSYYASGVLDKWMTMQIRLMSTTPADFNGPFTRIYAYSGIAAYCSVSPGIPSHSPHNFSASLLNQAPVMPAINPGKEYHWPSSVNAALASMNRLLFPMTSPSNKASIDSLENEMYKIFGRETDHSTIEYSASYGKLVAQRVFAWAEADGYLQSNDPYKPPAGKGLWQPTAPKFANAVTPYWGRIRTIVPGSIEGTQPPPPPSYSEDSSSQFYDMVKEVYDISYRLTTEQINIAKYWKDINPGVTAPGHWLNILRQVIQTENIRLDRAALAYAITGICLNDTWISSWKTRYTYNVLRPITYIQTVIGHKDWTPLLPTPPHPEYPGGHAAMSSAVAEALTALFGNNLDFTDHTYAYLGMAPRKYSSFRAIAKEAGDSKLYGGIHYRLSIDVGLQQGKDVTRNVVAVLLSDYKP